MMTREQLENLGPPVTAWADGRLGQAYGLVEAVRLEHLSPRIDQILAGVLEEIEGADIAIEKRN